MRSQLPLPLLQAGAAEIAPGVGLLAGEDGGLVPVRRGPTRPHSARGGR